MKKNLFDALKLKSLLFHIFVPLMLSFTITMIIPSYDGFLKSLNKPLEVPSIVFAIVWPILYILMGISAYIVDNKESGDVSQAMKVYYIQLFVNLMYPVVFFYLKSIVFGTILTLVLLGLVILTMVKFKKISKLSFYLLIPYLLWLLFANYLQVGIYFLN